VSAEANQGRLDLAFATSPNEIVAEANQGSVTILLPDEDVFYATQTEADQGSATSDIREDPTADRTITAESNQGSITITYAP
jgi:hypothetical protein